MHAKGLSVTSFCLPAPLLPLLPSTFPPLLSTSLPFPILFLPSLLFFPSLLLSLPLHSSYHSPMARTMVSHWTECWVETTSIVCSWGAATLPSSDSLSCDLMCWWNCSCLTTREASGTKIYTSTVLSWMVFAYKHVNYSCHLWNVIHTISSHIHTHTHTHTHTHQSKTLPSIWRDWCLGCTSTTAKATRHSNRQLCSPLRWSYRLKWPPSLRRMRRLTLSPAAHLPPLTPIRHLYM